jgi:hypothetical protein
MTQWCLKNTKSILLIHKKRLNPPFRPGTPYRDRRRWGTRPRPTWRTKARPRPGYPDHHDRIARSAIFPRDGWRGAVGAPASSGEHGVRPAPRPRAVLTRTRSTTQRVQFARGSSVPRCATTGKRRLADEYDAAQERGEVAKGRPKSIPGENTGLYSLAEVEDRFLNPISTMLRIMAAMAGNSLGSTCSSSARNSAAISSGLGHLSSRNAGSAVDRWGSTGRARADQVDPGKGRHNQQNRDSKTVCLDSFRRALGLTPLVAQGRRRLRFIVDQ